MLCMSEKYFSENNLEKRLNIVARNNQILFKNEEEWKEIEVNEASKYMDARLLDEREDEKFIEIPNLRRYFKKLDNGEEISIGPARTDFKDNVAIEGINNLDGVLESKEDEVVYYNEGEITAKAEIECIADFDSEGIPIVNGDSYNLEDGPVFMSEFGPVLFLEYVEVKEKWIYDKIENIEEKIEEVEKDTNELLDLYNSLNDFYRKDLNKISEVIDDIKNVSKDLKIYIKENKN